MNPISQEGSTDYEICDHSSSLQNCIWSRFFFPRLSNQTPHLLLIVICQRHFSSSEGSRVEPKPATLQINSFFSCLSPCQDPQGFFFSFHPMRRTELWSAPRSAQLPRPPECPSMLCFFKNMAFCVCKKKGKSCCT